MWVDPSSTASYQPLVNSLTSSVVSSSWTTEPTQKIQANDAGSNDKFGSSVAISGNYAIVGVPYKDSGTGTNQEEDAGAAYIFNIISGTGEMQQIAKLRPSDREEDDNFGWSVAISGNYAIVGAAFEDGPINDISNSGAAYIFDLTTTTAEMNPIARLRPSDRGNGDIFGGSV